MTLSIGFGCFKAMDTWPAMREGMERYIQQQGLSWSITVMTGITVSRVQSQAQALVGWLDEQSVAWAQSHGIPCLYWNMDQSQHPNTVPFYPDPAAIGQLGNAPISVEVAK